MALIENISAPVFVAEANQPLRNWWQWLIRDTDTLVERMAFYREEFRAAGHDRSVFDAMRDGWNEQKKQHPDSIDTAGWLWCLVYQSTNNLARFNSSGGYNQTWGQGRKVPDPMQVYGPDELRAVNCLADAVSKGCLADDAFKALDLFMEYVDDIGAGYCYLDPPYIVQTETYDRKCWTRPHVDKLMNYIEGLDTRNIPWLMTEYMAKGDKTHPYSASLYAHYRVLTLDRKMDARPKGEQLPTEEVVVLGDWVDTDANDSAEDFTEPVAQQTLF